MLMAATDQSAVTANGRLDALSRRLNHLLVHHG
jgi:hypothetical protein